MKKVTAKKQLQDFEGARLSKEAQTKIKGGSGDSIIIVSDVVGN